MTGQSTDSWISWIAVLLYLAVCGLLYAAK